MFSKKITLKDIDTVSLEHCARSMRDIIDDAKKVNDSILEDFKAELGDKGYSYSEESLINASDRTSMHWVLAYHVTPYCLGHKKLEESYVYQKFFKLYLEKFESASEGLIKKKDIVKFADEQVWHALGAMHAGGPYLMWWDIFFYLHKMNPDLPSANHFVNMTLTAYATEIIKCESEIADHFRRRLKSFRIVQ